MDPSVLKGGLCTGGTGSRPELDRMDLANQTKKARHRRSPHSGQRDVLWSEV
eukprot:CAMPEP_0206135538 /NCGR_PEP_ID=MMETSP1473-20131121/810_1 /ASSEMBLY_ACC=CAM_ASM_001109 /TAXON_ID=1461547 /ORGANISM="Stichococcus sp, Strain RCC1054" /LENGTH=51 /DNA_ID=CAMNT_0053527453 /DNA_START=22 /DNA_END=174 /DNA_ORIENTATION=-